MEKNTALIVGATGLVGKELVKVILSKKYYTEIKILTRRELNYDDSRVSTILLDDFEKMGTVKKKLEANDYFCLLGTTMKKAGSKKKFKKVDYQFPLSLAKIAVSSSSFNQFLVVTSAGANSSSPLFYNKTKGKLEDELKALQMSALKIFQPSLLLGDREEFRLGESIGKVLSHILTFFMVGAKKGMFAIQASDVAKAIFLVARDSKKGVKIYKSSAIQKLAKSAGI